MGEMKGNAHSSSGYQTRNFSESGKVVSSCCSFLAHLYYLHHISSLQVFNRKKKNSKEFLEKDSLLTSLDVSGSHWRDHGITLGADSSRVLWPFATSAMDLLRRFLRKGTFLAIFLLIAVLPRSLLIMLYIYTHKFYIYV